MAVCLKSSNAARRSWKVSGCNPYLQGNTRMVRIQPLRHDQSRLPRLTRSRASRDLLDLPPLLGEGRLHHRMGGHSTRRRRANSGRRRGLQHKVAAKSSPVETFKETEQSVHLDISFWFERISARPHVGNSRASRYVPLDWDHAPVIIWCGAQTVGNDNEGSPLVW